MRRTRIALAALLVVALGACAQPGFSARKVQRQLVEAGLTEQQAECVTNALENTFDTGQLGSRVDVDDIAQREFEKTRSILVDTCEVDPAQLDSIEP